MAKVQLSAESQARRDRLRHLLIPIKDVVKFSEGTYAEVASHLDQREIMILAEKQGTWSSLKLDEAVKTGSVKAIKQSFVRHYDQAADAYVFEREGDVNIDIRESLQGPSVWTPGQVLTNDDVFDICEMLIEKVCIYPNPFAKKELC